MNSLWQATFASPTSLSSTKSYSSIKMSLRRKKRKTAKNDDILPYSNKLHERGMELNDNYKYNWCRQTCQRKSLSCPVTSSTIPTNRTITKPNNSASKMAQYNRRSNSSSRTSMKISSIRWPNLLAIFPSRRPDPHLRMSPSLASSPLGSNMTERFSAFTHISRNMWWRADLKIIVSVRFWFTTISLTRPFS